MTRRLAVAVAAAVGFGLVAPSAFAGLYPTDICVSAKLNTAAKKCKADLKAWSKWETSQDNGTRDAALGLNGTKFSDAWTKADDKATAKGVNCADTTVTSATMAATIDAAVNDIVNSINTGLTLANPADASCGAALVKAAATKCGAFLKAESKFMKKRAKDPQGVARDALRDKASTKFADAFTKATAGGCPTAATAVDLEDKVDEVTDTAVTDTTVSPNVATTWTAITPPIQVFYNQLELRPICSRNTPYTYYVKRGTGDGEHKLLMYYQGGGACWDSITCDVSVGAFDDDVSPSDNPANTTTGFGDLNNPDNPFHNWNAVFVSYCTGDIHWGDNQAFYNFNGPYSIQHRGYQNAKVAEKWAREHFVNPDEIFVTGSSAGAYGAILHGIFLHDVYPASQFDVVGDAGNGVITQEFLQNDLESAWHVQQHLPTYIPGLNADVTTLTIADLYGKAALFFNPRGSRFGQYTTAFDGGGGSQTFFYNVMVNGVLDAGSWWHTSCPWNAKMLANSVSASTQAPSNYRYYVGPGARHTIWGSNRVYTETHGGVPTFVQWLNDMRAGNPGWTNVACSDCSLLGSCVGGSNGGASCQHDSECPAGVCNLVDAKPPFTCNGASSNPGASCQRDADCPGGACQIEASFGVCSSNSTSNPDKLCSTNGDCPGGTCVTEQPFQLDGVISCPP